MYKVFIENRPIIFTQKHTSLFESKLLFADKIKSIEADILPLIKKTEPKIAIYVICENPKETCMELFKNYQRIHAGGGIVCNGNEFLFIKRNGKWDIPKGKLDVDETPELGSIREIEEECGITGLKIDHLICCTYHTYKNKGKNKMEGKNVLKCTFWYAMTYRGNEELVPQLEEGITKAKWFTRQKVDKVESNTFESIREVIRHYFDAEHQISGYRFDL